MSKRISKWIAIPLVAIALTSPARASVVCLAPEPVCVTVLVTGLVTGIVSAEEDDELQHLQVGRNRSALEAIVREVRHTNDGRLAIRVRDAARYRPGFNSIVNRFEKGRFDGRLSLASLMDFDPQLFADLDRIADVIGQHYPQRVMNDTYGPRTLAGSEVNWQRYANLAREALVIHHNFFVIAE